MSGAPGTAGPPQYVIRRAAAADLDWINSNDMGWSLVEHGGHRAPYSLDEAWTVLIADDPRGASLGWMYVVDAGDHLTAQLLYVDPHHRRRGVARVLMEYLKATTRGRSCWARGIAACSRCGPRSGSSTSHRPKANGQATSAAAWSARRFSDPPFHGCQLSRAKPDRPAPLGPSDTRLLPATDREPGLHQPPHPRPRRRR
ncbi:hypothetical protein GCM10023191_101940 [Actinoallomurus oryzae]|uniref:N-acetyltransferase domain-containing protein n=1 Tax=Actinoallomurus oryzae TaxID=502180 RepID=A0ABP8RA17_9ACTN